MFTKIFANICYYVNIDIIVYKNKFCLFLLSIYYNLVINKKNYIDIIYFFCNYILVFFLKKIKILLITKNIKKTISKHLFIFLLIFLNNIIKQLNFVVFVNNILFIIKISSYLHFVYLKNLCSLFNNSIFIIFNLLKIYFSNFLNNK